MEITLTFDIAGSWVNTVTSMPECICAMLTRFHTECSETRRELASYSIPAAQTKRYSPRRAVPVATQQYHRLERLGSGR